jgi:hypothetical protein
MSLGYPSQTPLQYNPFAKTSFGFGTNALQNLPNNPFPNATDYVRVVITVDDATHWDDSGHIQTAEVGTAVSSYSSESFIWEVEGERNDVETILAELVFYPPAYQPLSDWQPTPLKENIDDGSYTNEEPADTAAVPDTQMEIVVYSSTNWVTAYDIYVEAVNPIYNNPRPYFSSSVQIIDVADSAFDTVQGDLLPLNLVVEHTDSEEILEVKSEFIRTTNGTRYTGTAYGIFTDYQDIYIGGKKGIPQNTTDKRFNFIGKKDECNLFLENLEFTTKPSIYQLPAESSFFLRTSVSDGQVGSYVDTLIWHSDTYPRWYGNLTGQSFTEDTAAGWDFGVITFNNLDAMGECDIFSAIVTLGNGGENGVAFLFTTTEVDYQSLENGVMTITDSDPNVILTALRNLVYIPKQDFNSNFSLALKFHFQSSVYGTSYVQSTDGVTVTVSATPQDELSNPHITYNFAEDFPQFMQTAAYPQIIHPHNETFQVDFIADQNGIGNILTINQNVTFEKLSEGHTRFTGSKNDVNNALYTMLYSPNPDINGQVSFTIELNRLTGNLDYHTTTYGSITLTGQPRDEYTFTNPGPLDWEEDVSLSFDPGLEIVDDATVQLYLPAYGTEYTVNVRLRDPDGNQFTNGVMKFFNKNGLTSYNDYGDEFTMTGSRSAINACLQNIKFVPDVDWEGYDGDYVEDDYVNIGYVEIKNTSFYIDFHIQRNYDSVVLVNYSHRIFFNPPTIHEETSYTPTEISDNVWIEDRILSFDSGIQILDKATENSDYPLYNGTYKLEAKTYGIDLYVDENYSFMEDLLKEKDVTAPVNNFSFIYAGMFVDIPPEIWTVYSNNISNPNFRFEIEWYHNYFKSGAPTTWTDDWQNNEFFKLNLGISEYGDYTNPFFNVDDASIQPGYYTPVIIDPDNQQFIFVFRSTDDSQNLNTIIRDVFQNANQEPAEDLNMNDDMFRIKLYGTAENYTEYSEEYNYSVSANPTSEIIVSTDRKDLLVSYSGTGTPDDPFLMEATKNNMNICLSQMHISTAEPDLVLNHNKILVKYKLYRVYDNELYYDYDIFTRIGKMQEAPEITIGELDPIDWNINQYIPFSSLISITDDAVTNPYFNVIGTGYTIEVKALIDQGLYVEDEYVDTDYISTLAELDNINIGSTRTDTVDSYSGTTKVGDPLIVNGSATGLNTFFDNCYFSPDLNWTSSDPFYITFKITRDFDNEVFLNHGDHMIHFNPSLASELFSINTSHFFYATDDYNQLTFSSEGNNFVVLNDHITENPLYPDYFGTDYLIKIRFKIFDESIGTYRYTVSDAPTSRSFIENNPDDYRSYTNVIRADFNNRFVNNTQGGTGNANSLIIGGEYVSQILYFEGTRSQINFLINGFYYNNKSNIRVNVRPDHTEPFYMELYVERLYDNVIISDWETIELRNSNAYADPVGHQWSKIIAPVDYYEGDFKYGSRPTFDYRWVDGRHQFVNDTEEAQSALAYLSLWDFTGYEIAVTQVRNSTGEIANLAASWDMNGYPDVTERSSRVIPLNGLNDAIDTGYYSPDYYHSNVLLLQYGVEKEDSIPLIQVKNTATP